MGEKVNGAAEVDRTIWNHQPRFRPYPNYKDSVIDWLGQIPAHWNVNRLRWTVTRCQNGLWGDEPDGLRDTVCVRVADFDRVRFRATLGNPTLRSVDPKVAQSRLLHRGDLLLEKSGGGEKQPVGAVVIYDDGKRAVCSNFVARMSVSPSHHARYLAYLHSALYAARINTRSIKQSTGIQNLDSARYLSEAVGLPGEREQHAIATFLDRETAKIGALVAKKERLIELLQEQRTALITGAVTRGLDPKVPIKDSGVKWLGKIPAHWGVKRLKTLASVHLSNVDKKTEAGEVPVELCNYVDVYYNDFITADLDFMRATATPEQARRFQLRRGDILITKDSESWDDIAVPALVVEDLVDVLCGYHLAHIRPGRDVLGRVLARQFSAIGIRDQFHLSANGITRFGIGRNAIRTSLFPVAPLDDQRAIAHFLDRETAKIDALVAKIYQAIEHLAEYRTALISAAVTGKIDVRKEAA